MSHLDETMDSASSQENSKSLAMIRGSSSERMGSSASSEFSFDDKSSRPSSTGARAVTTTNTTSSNDSSSVKDDSSQVITAARRSQNRNQYRKRSFSHHLDRNINHESSVDKSSMSTDPDQDSDLKQEGTFPRTSYKKSVGDPDLRLTASVLQSRYGGPSKRSSFITLTSSSHGNSDMTPMEDVPEPHSENSASDHGSDTGYSASASSNDVFCIGQSSCSSPSMSSSEDQSNHIRQRRFTNLDPTTMGEMKRRSESSSDIADFSSTQSARRSSSPSSSCSSRDELTGFDLEKPVLEDNTEEKYSYLPLNSAATLTLPFQSSGAAHKRSHNPRDTMTPAKPCQSGANIHSSPPTKGIVSYSVDHPMIISNRKMDYPTSKRQSQIDVMYKHSQKSIAAKAYLGSKPTTCTSRTFTQADLKMKESLMYSVGVDIMGVVMSFLNPVESHKFLTMPISKTFRALYTQPQDLWKVLCLSDPFLVKVNDRDGANSSGDESSGSFPICDQLGVRHTLGKYRLLYTSFIRCVRYLARIKEDAINGRLPLAVEENMDASEEALGTSIANSPSLMDFFAQAREFIHEDQQDLTSSDSDSESVRASMKSPGIFQSVEVCDDKKIILNDQKPKIKYSHSTLTDRLLGPSKVSKVAGPVELPWSCAIYSVVNWLVAFSDVEGIQIMCLKVLPYMLEDENQRTIAQRAGLTDIVLRSMVRFPSSVALHIASFHTLVLLARPLGGREGMLFHVAMLNTSGILCSKSGIAVMLDSMKRFADYEVLQAMACWSLVNIALIPAQKKVLVSLGGIAAAANAMMKHPLNPDVQFRALFSLINLVIPSNNVPENAPTSTQMVDAVEQSERELLDESVTRISNLVVLAMRNFCSSEAILNRACLVLHNLSLNEEYHRTLLFTPHCYQMLEWCIANYRNDSVLQQSAGGTLQRLQLSLASDDMLRSHFADTLRSQELPGNARPASLSA